MENEKYNKLFVGGDLSGIQKFLYNITSSHATVSLKGRSAYLSNYMIEVRKQLEKAANEAGATTRVIYESGGKLYMIADNSDAIQRSIDQCASKIKADLWKKQLGQLGINIAYVPFSENEDGTVDVDGRSHVKSGELWRLVNGDFARQKNQKFKELLLSSYGEFFDGNDKRLKVGGKPRICALSGVESDRCRPLSKKDFEAMNVDDMLLDEDGSIYDGRVYHPSVIEQIVLGTKLASEEGLKSFEEYADGSYIGVLRMDVDGMGKRFIIGFDSIAKYESFSREVTWFFEGKGESSEPEKRSILDMLHESISEGIDKGRRVDEFMCIIYAGGDDIFIVGRWDKVIDFAKKIHDATSVQFPKAYDDPFDAEVPQKYISISGGIAIVKPKFPIAKAADMAGEAEDAAKAGEKNAFCMFGKVISWNERRPYIPFTGCEELYIHEFDYVEKFKNKFVHYVQDFDMNRSLLHKMMLYSSLADKNKELKSQHKKQDFRYVWHMTYYLSRFMDSYKNYAHEQNPETRRQKSELFSFIRNLRDHHLTLHSGRNLELIALAARWAELILKDNPNI